jgi:hypothetical protein
MKRLKESNNAAKSMFFLFMMVWFVTLKYEKRSASRNYAKMILGNELKLKK